MLFKAEIPNDILTTRGEYDKPIERLCEQLYIFLSDYVPTRLLYESDEEREDCKQDTIMYLLDRFNSLTEEDLKDLNLEKFFYNRSRSYVSLYLRKIKEKRALIRKYKDYVQQIRELEEQKKEDYIDYKLLNLILSRYRLEGRRLSIFRDLSINKLVRLGYKDIIIEISDEDLYTYDPNNVLDILSYAVVDEYLISVVETKGAD